MAFRPLYILASLFGAAAVLLWGFGFTGHTALPGFFWHAHEMIWGYAGAVVVAFLLTAVATWTSQPPTRGSLLMLITALWLLARLGAAAPQGIWITAFSGSLFFWLAAVDMARSVIVSRNRRNYIAVAALFLLGATHAAFHWQLLSGNAAALRAALWAGLIMVAGFIGLVGMRVIPFFTARRLGGDQVNTPPMVIAAALALPMLMAAGLIVLPEAGWLLWAGVLCGASSLWQLCRWWRRDVLAEPLLWILYLGFACCALGLAAMGIGSHWPRFFSIGVHLISVGGIGLLTLGMMARTALGHTGRPMKLVAPLTLAFWLMVTATLLRIMAIVLPAAYSVWIYSSSLCFAAALLLYVYRYAPWLLTPRADGKAG